MVKSKPEPASEPGKQSIEELQKRYTALHKKQIEAETNLKNARDRLDELKKEARQQFGTDDVAELQSKLMQMHQKNEEERGQYQADLVRIETELKAVEEKFAAEEK